MINRPHHHFLITLSLLLLAVTGMGSSIGNSGLVPIKNYSQETYSAYAQNYAIAQDQRGIMYFGNRKGVLSYDGESWDLIQLPNEAKATALAKGNGGRIFVGGLGEMGYLRPDSAGTMRYKSLLSEEQKDSLENNTIWNIHTTEKGVFFQSEQKLFRWKDGKFNSWAPEQPLRSFFHLDGHFFVKKVGKGLARFKNGEFIPIAFKEGGTSEKKVLGMCPHHEDGSYVIATQNQGLFLFRFNKDGKSTLEPFNVNIDDAVLKNPGLNNALSLGDQKYSLGTWGKGVVTIGKGGRVIRWFDKPAGLQNGVVKDQFLDREKNLWLALNNGITKIEISEPLSHFNNKVGLSGTVEAVTEYKGALFVATHTGLHYYPRQMERQEVRGSDREVFYKIDDFSSECWSLLRHRTPERDMLLVAVNNGIFALHTPAERFTPGTDPVVKRLNQCAPWTLFPSKANKDRVYIGLNDGISSLLHKNGLNWKDEGKVEGIGGRVFNFDHGKGQSIWAGTRDNGVYKWQDKPFEKGRPEKMQYEHFDSLNGGISGPIYVERTDGINIFGSPQGLYHFKEETGSFEPYEGFGDQFTDKGRYIHRIRKVKNGDLWMVTVYKEKKNGVNIGYIPLEKDREKWVDKPFYPLSSGVIQTLYQDSLGNIWMGGLEGLYHYDPKSDWDFDRSFTSTIREVMIGEDSTIFSGNFLGPDGSADTTQPNFMTPSLPYEDNELTFHFAAQSYQQEEKTEYSYKLEGFDEKWSMWKPENKAIYTNIPEGTYTFRVRARNIYKNESREGAYQFTILPPWYRTIWAYGGYGIALLLVIQGAIKVSLIRVRKQKEKLERIVEERTQQIEEKKKNLEEANASITEQKELIEEKNEDIMASIKYAQRIQEAILPPDGSIERFLPDSFILFKPKDIVSGDFYWLLPMNKEGNEPAEDEAAEKILFSAIDCTGHGVPGAFVSIVGHDGLNRTVREFGITDPGRILDKLNVIVEDTFRQQEKVDVKDGMDMAICSYEPNSGVLEFAGANNPLYLIKGDGNTTDPELILLDEDADPNQIKTVKNEDGVIFEVKADKQPIGAQEDKKPFTTHQVRIEPGDSVYTFSDGYADQFGGPKGKKFKYRNFKTLLLSIRHKPMQEQKEILDKTIEDWRAEADIEQIDDIVVFGVRFN